MDTPPDADEGNLDQFLTEWQEEIKAGVLYSYTQYLLSMALCSQLLEWKKLRL